MKYAIVESGGKQYKVVEGSTIEVDRLPLEVGKKVDLTEVLLISNEGKFSIGTPTVSGAKVKATVIAQVKAPKVIVFKYKAKERYRVKTGHRAQYTRLMIDKVEAKAASKKAEAKTEEKETKKETASAAAES